MPSRDHQYGCSPVGIGLSSLCWSEAGQMDIHQLWHLWASSDLSSTKLFLLAQHLSLIKLVLIGGTQGHGWRCIGHMSSLAQPLWNLRINAVSPKKPPVSHLWSHDSLIPALPAAFNQSSCSRRLSNSRPLRRQAVNGNSSRPRGVFIQSVSLPPLL